MDDVGRVLITADDANVCSNIDRAILELTELGVVTNVALFANTDSQFNCERCLKSDATLSIHLNLTHGHPVSEISQNSTLVTKNGNFFSPKDLLEPSRERLADTISRYKASVLPYLDRNEIECELRAQVHLFERRFGELPIYNSFHQDLDTDDRVFDLVECCSNIPKTREHLLQSGQLAGFQYSLFDESTSPQSYVPKVEKMLSSAILTSAKCGGVPFEIALHPSTCSAGLKAFTAYREQRVYEFDAWRSDNVVAIVRSGNRDGTIISFPVDAPGRV